MCCFPVGPIPTLKGDYLMIAGFLKKPVHIQLIFKNEKQIQNFHKVI